MVADAARAYARDKLLPRVVNAFAEERFDREIMTEMGQLGFLGPTLPEAYGQGSREPCRVWPDRPRNPRRSIAATARR